MNDWQLEALMLLLREMAERRRAFWVWSSDEWIDSIHRHKLVRQQVLAIAYLLCGVADLHRIENDQIVYLCLARKVFGREYVDVIAQGVRKVLVEWGYRIGTQNAIVKTLYEALLYVRSPHLRQLTIDQLQAVVERHPPRTGSYCKVALSRVLASMGIIPEALKIERPPRDKQRSPSLVIGVPAEWARLCGL